MNEGTPEEINEIIYAEHAWCTAGAQQMSGRGWMKEETELEAMSPEVRRLREVINETKRVVVRKAAVKNAVIREKC